MTLQKIADALQRAQAVLTRRPSIGSAADAPARAEWKQGARVVTSHPGGMAVETDLPAELGGTGDQVSAGWLFRAGLASCAATSIVLVAAAQGIDLASLDVEASSRSDTRGLLGMAGATGQPVDSSPDELVLQVRVAARGVAADRLRAVVRTGIERSPIPNVVLRATAIDLRIDVAMD